MGGVRHIADIKADNLSREGTATIGLQSGSNKGASQAGARSASLRHVSCTCDVTVAAVGMAIGAVRHVSDIRSDDMSKDGASVIGLQAGSNKGASQAGMKIGATR